MISKAAPQTRFFLKKFTAPAQPNSCIREVALLDAAILMIESRGQPTLTPEHTDPVPSVLCIISGCKVVKLREDKVGSRPQLA